jgi:hypothetical protein
VAPSGLVPDEPEFGNQDEWSVTLALFGFTPMEPPFGELFGSFQTPFPRHKAGLGRARNIVYDLSDF